MIKCVIYDMDGTLTDSEPFWRLAEKAAFKKVDIELTDQMLSATMGMRCDEVVNHWFDLYPWDKYTKKQIELEILSKVQKMIEAKAKALPGVIESLEFFMDKQIPIALASSSPLGIIQSVVATLGMEKYFKVTCSAEFEEFGKPHPGVFIATANYMRVEPKECLVFEDSVNGVLAAKAALMKCIAIPDKEQFMEPKFAIADKVISSLELMNDKMWSQINE